VELHIRAAKVGEDIAALDRPSMPWNLGRLVLAHAAVERAAA
jgi:hypothetical protein